MVWMHGKMYRRSFFSKYNIRFNDSRANEDVGFNTQCQCYNEDEGYILVKTWLIYGNGVIIQPG